MCVCVYVCVYVCMYMYNTMEKSLGILNYCKSTNCQLTSGSFPLIQNPNYKI